jgi:predicted thioesterase
MVGHIEGLCLKMLIPFQDQGESSVGYRVDVRHIAPTPIGQKVTIKGRVKEQEARKVVFEVEAYNEGGTKIGEGLHERRVIDLTRSGEQLAARMAVRLNASKGDRFQAYTSIYQEIGLLSTLQLWKTPPSRPSETSLRPWPWLPSPFAPSLSRQSCRKVQFMRGRNSCSVRLSASAHLTLPPR